MRLTAIILLIACLQVSARTGAQTVTLSLKNASLEKLFTEIKKQTGYSFVYNNSFLERARKVTIRVKGAPLAEVLERCFADQPLSYSIIDRTIVVKPMMPDLNEETTTIVNDPPPPINVHGKVSNEKDEPAPGVTVTVKGTKNATAANEAGEFFLKGVANNATLVFTSTNMETREVQISGRTEMAVQLKTKASSLDEMKIIAYGTTSERLRTGAVSSVTAETIEKQPVADVLLALQGQVPGLNIVQKTALPGARVEFTIRGLNSLMAESGSGAMQDPLVVIDGVPFSTDYIMPATFAALTRENNYAENQGISALAAINPRDIERIDVLKDADATAIYGSRGANGVILVTTKKAHAGKPSLTIDISQGFMKLSRRLDLLTTRQYLNMRYEAFANDGINWRDAAVTADDLKVWDTTRYTDFQKELLGGTAKFTTANVNYAGGNPQSSYRLSVNYMRQGSIYGNQFADMKFSGQMSFNHRSANNRLSFDVSTLYTYNDNLQTNANFWRVATSLAPIAPTLYNEDGSLNWENGKFMNPLAQLERSQEVTSHSLNTRGSFSYALAKNLTLRADAGFTRVDHNLVNLTPLAAQDPFDNTLGSAARRGVYARNYTYITKLNSQANYKAVLGPGRLDALLGFTTERQGKDYHNIIASDFISDDLMNNYGAASTVQYYPVRSSDYRYVGGFARLGYNIRNRYLFTLNGNRDGSSRFGPGKQFGNFGSAGLAWIFSEALGIKKALPFLSYGKLRLSYGITGSDNIGDYQYLPLYTPRQPLATFNPSYNAMEPVRLFNPNYGWEKSRKADVELSLGFLNDRILATANYYNNRTSNQLIGELLPLITGFDVVNGNGAATVENSGWELELKTEIVKSRNFSWSSNANISFPRNKLVSYPNLESSSLARYFSVGKPIHNQRAYDFVRVDPQTGLNVYRTAGGKDTSMPAGNASLPFADQYLYISLMPKFEGGWTNTFRYKGWSLSLSMQYNYSTRGNDIATLPTEPGFPGNITQYVYNNSWRKPGDQALFQKFTTNRFTAAHNSRTFHFTEQYYGNYWYLSLNNASLFYALPKQFLQRLHLSSCMLRVNAQNLFAVSNLKEVDPTTNGVNSMPRMRVVTAGVNLNF